MGALRYGGQAGEYLVYASAEHAFMAVPMFAIESGEVQLQVERDRLAAAVPDDENYRPARFAGRCAL